MRVGIFGGAFNPVHLGHLLLAEQCREQCELDEVCFVPTGRPPHRDVGTLAPGDDRVAMLERAIAPNPAFRVDRSEIDCGAVSYTVDTLTRVHAERPGAELFLLLTDDWLAAFHTWKQPERIAELATIVVVNRETAQDHVAAVGAAADKLPRGVRERLRPVRMPGTNIAGTDLRRRLAEGRSVRYLTPDAVADYATGHQLYGAPAAPATRS